MNVLSLFDGMSCGQIALRELGVEPEVYYASEIDKYAIRQTQYNFPATVQLGDVERWREWEIDWAGIDLVLAGSPCQGFSFAGKQLAFDDPRSRLFFVFADILTHVRKANPNVRFLLENVNMKREYLRVISEHVGVSPVRINSALVSAQNRNRWYWTDIKTWRDGLSGELYADIPQPIDRGIVLGDILEENVSDKYNVSEKMARYITDPKRLGKYTDLNDGSRKSACLVAKTNNSWTETFLVQRQRGYNRGGTHTDKAPTLSAAGMGGALSAVIQLNPAREFGSQPRQQNRIYSPAGKSPTLNAGTGGNLQAKILTDRSIRRLTPTECAQLQTIPAWYEWVVSDTQIYRLLGNGWTVEVIKWILSFWDKI
ncbi:DNA cytosine methyltransferase [uncultured Rikenella sp.]|uniref:DNA cytosine methyltransferase n=1 Tax=uncultured Rikenella sp. TaxID=368003 RepID=UPI00272CB390|nr:DNA cytosine methyltransferase [uncultured Rikenella sp.]